MESGIYKITINNHLYIGSAVNLRKRKIRHLWDLRKNQHCNKRMQRAFNKYGEMNFNFEVIENALKDILLAREQFFLEIKK